MADTFPKLILLIIGVSLTNISYCDYANYLKSRRDIINNVYIINLLTPVSIKDIYRFICYVMCRF